MSQALLQVVLPLAGTALLGILSAVSVLVGQWMRQRGRNARATELMLRVVAVAQSAVAYVDADVKAGLVQAAADGKVTPEEAAALQQLALGRVKAWLGEQFPGEAEEALGIAAPMVMDWLRGVIQKSVQGARAAP